MRDADLITIPEAARLLGYAGRNPTGSVRHLVRAGRLTPVEGPRPEGKGFKPSSRWLRRSDVLRVRDELRRADSQRTQAARARQSQLPPA